MGFRTRSRSSSVDSFSSIDNYQSSKKRKLKKVKEDVVNTLQKVVEEKEVGLVIDEDTKPVKIESKPGINKK